jgi:hypothetical protein
MIDTFIFYIDVINFIHKKSYLLALYSITKINPMGIPISFANILGYLINQPANTTLQKLQYGVGGFE